jgi:hypothetical protein
VLGKCAAAGLTSVGPPYGVGVTEIPAALAAELVRLRAENARLLKMLELSPRQAAPPRSGAGRVLRCAAWASS